MKDDQCPVLRLLCYCIELFASKLVDKVCQYKVSQCHQCSCHGVNTSVLYQCQSMSKKLIEWVYFVLNQCQSPSKQ